MIKEELIQELKDINPSFVNDIITKMSNLDEKFMISSQNMTMLIQSCSSVKNLTHLLTEIIQLERKL